ncbi:MAG: HEAT repeat domain-containing protein [Thermoguttaceae bacterium]|jgi:hypothetical protein|nr:HEAT repeat domain-containing protein [Thermoguttaceae bacterium]
MQKGPSLIARPYLFRPVFAAMLVFGIVGGPVTAAELTPESPQVREAIDRALKFIEDSGESDSRMGGQALVGLALLKHGSHRDHPQIRRAVATITKSLEGRDLGVLKSRNEVYSLGLATIFLVELDPSTYRREIELLLEILRRAQKPHGGWGYSDRETGDTSMVQYAALAMWEAKRAGFNVPQTMIEGLADWLLRTQDPSGGFGYQGKVSTTRQLVAQSSVRLSLSAAGLGSLYICADLLELSDSTMRQEEGIPPALREVREERAAARRAKTRIDANQVRAAQQRGNQWIAKNFEINPKQYAHYYLYALERYMSFREAADGTDSHRISWYSQGAAFLVKTQEDKGSWTGQTGTTVDTAFGLLFLMRSMKKSIEKAQELGAGLLVGGRGLPKDTSRVEVRRGQVIARPLLGPAEELLAMLDDPDADEYDRALAHLTDLTPEEAQQIFGTRPDRLRQLARDASPEARIAAVTALAAGRDLSAVPLLIHTLDDPHVGVVRAARDSLRRLARKPAGFGLPDTPSDADRAAAVRQWKAWYRAVCPTAEFEN